MPNHKMKATQKHKLVPALRFKDDDGNDFPDWEVKRLGEIADVSKLAGYEFTKHITYEDRGNIIALRGLNIKNNKLDLSDVRYIDNSELSKLKRSKLFVNDLMFTYVGTIGEVALIDENNKYYLAPNVSRIRADKKKVNPVFLLQYFNVSSFKNNEISKYIASSSQPALTMGNVRRFVILLPSLPEQTKIADCLSSADDLIDATADKLAALKKHKKGLMQQLFPAEGESVPKLRFPEFRGAEDWEVKELGEVATFSKGKGLPKNELNAEGINPCIHYGQLFTEYSEVIKHVISFTNLSIKNCMLSKENDVLMPTSDVTPNGLAKACCIKQDNVILGGDILIIRPIHNGVCGEFLSRYIRHLEHEVLRYVTGSTVFHLYASSMKFLKLFLPSLPEQTKIADCLSSADDLIAATADKLAALKKHKKGLMQQLFPAQE